ncbi:MAG: hypothetical protein DRP83_04040 [Planctomycetota bacterium]|nr:MAG: hypothetical protein DRP83_04040 [Planctomycetota bacterium]
MEENKTNKTQSPASHARHAVGKIKNRSQDSGVRKNSNNRKNSNSKNSNSNGKNMVPRLREDDTGWGIGYFFAIRNS